MKDCTQDDRIPPHSDIFAFTDSDQEELYRRLSLLGPGPAAFFRDVCYLITAKTDLPESTTHLVAHLLREIEGAVVAVLAPLSKAPENRDPIKGHRNRVAAILSMLTIPKDGHLSRRWLAIVDDWPFHRLAHRDNLRAPRRIDRTFEGFVEDLQYILLGVLRKYDTKFLKVMDYVDWAVSQHHLPGDIRERLPENPLAQGQLFKRLENPDWLPHLKAKGFLDRPPDLVSDPDGNLRGTYVWPQADYLKKMAARGDRAVQEQVLEIMLDVGGTNNSFIHCNFAQGALAMPPGLAAKWAEHEADWLRAENAMFGMLEDDLGRLVSYLAQNGEVDTALDLAAELLAVFEDPEAGRKRAPSEDELDEIVNSSLQPRIRCRKHSYEQILQRNVPDLAKAAPTRTLTLLSELLRKAIVCSLRDPQESKPYDLSSISRPAIEDHDQNHDFDFHHHLINSVRNVAEGICRSDPEKLREIVPQLEDIGWNIFRRIALYLLTVSDSAPRDLVEERLVGEAMSDDGGVHHEYFHLIEQRFPELSPAGQEQILTWIDEATREKQYLAEDERDLTKEQSQRRLKYWRYTKLIPIQDYLSGGWKVLFEELKSELGELEMPPDFHSWHGDVKAGSDSPKTPDDLATMSIEELIQYLKEWKPTGEWRGSTRNGLGSALNELVVNAPDRFVEHIDLFMDRDMDPTYVNHLIRAFHRILEDKRNLSFETVFRLCKWVVDNPSDAPGRDIPEDLRDGFDMDVDWSQTKKEISRLFEDKVFQDETGLPFEMREDAWAILEPLTEDPDPDLDYEAKYGGDNADPLHLSINHTRGKAMHAVMSYAMWVCRRVEKREDRKATLDDMPEVLAVLEKHLDIDSPVYGMCQTDRAVYGQRLPQIVHVGADWVEANLERIFPSDPELRHLREATWNTYLLYSRQLYHNVTRLISDVYREEIVVLKDKTFGEDTYKSPETRLAEHVVILYLWGEYGLEDDSLVDLLFKTAPEQITAHALDFLGRDAHGSKTVTDPIIVQRLKDLWEWRVEKAGGLDAMSRKELSTFGWWFAAGEFDNEWAFKWLEEVLKRTGISSSNIFAFERMSEVFAEHPAESLRCLKLFMAKNDEPWFFGRQDKGVWPILEQGMHHDSAEIRETTEDIIHRLGSMGYLEYRELLKGHVEKGGKE